MTPLICASDKGHVDIGGELIKAGANVNLINEVKSQT